MPRRQFLLGIWLLLCAFALVTGVALAIWFDTRFGVRGIDRLLLWSGCLGAFFLFILIGIVLERQLFAPLRHLHVQFARLSANPDARDDFPPEGWLSNLQPDVEHLRRCWQDDRARLHQAREEGARDAARIRQELEAVLQVLETPLLLCDRHQRVLMLNPAAEKLFAGHPALGLGRHLRQLLPQSNLSTALQRLPDDGSARQLLLHHEGRWLRCDLRRVSATQGEALLTLEDTTASQTALQRWRQPLAALLPKMRGHTASLTTTAEALSSAPANSPIRVRLEQGLQEETRTLSTLTAELAHLLESMQLDQGRLSDTWSNDLIHALQGLWPEQEIAITATGIPMWLRADTPHLLAMLERLLPEIVILSGQSQLVAEVCLGNRRVYLDFIWAGIPLTQKQLERLRELSISDDPLAPRCADVLQQHNSDWWCLLDADGQHARLRIPLPASERHPAPPRASEPRPEFHDFSIASLPEPSSELAQRRLRDLELVVFDTETTGLKLRQGDQIVSIGACRILNARLLANEVFDQKVNPGRPIPAASTAIHGLTDADVAEAPPLTVVLPRFNHFIGAGVLVAHNAAFDLLAISLHADSANVSFTMPVLDTLLLSRAIDPDLDEHGLDALAERFQLSFPPGSRHTALGDAQVTAELFLYLLPRLEARGVRTLSDALALQASMEPIQVG